MSGSVATLAYNVYLTRLFQVAATSTTLYDHLLTLDKEIELIWKKRWSMSKVLYIVNRYMGDTLLIFNTAVFINTTATDYFCYVSLRIQGWGGLTDLWVVQIIMQLRLYAMFRGSKKIMGFLLVCFLLETISLSLLLGFAHKSMQTTAYPVTGLTACIPLEIPSYFSDFWVVIIAFETILCSLAMWAGISYLREHGEWRTELLLNVLLRDSILYFIVCLTAYLTCGVIWFTLPPTWVEVTEGFTSGFTVIMGSRIVLNLRGAYYMSLTDEMSASAVYTEPQTLRLQFWLRGVSGAGASRQGMLWTLSSFKPTVSISNDAAMTTTSPISEAHVTDGVSSRLHRDA